MEVKACSNCGNKGTSVCKTCVSFKSWIPANNFPTLEGRDIDKDSDIING